MFRGLERRGHFTIPFGCLCSVGQIYNPMPPGFEVLHPGGMDENSPAFQRWDRSQTSPSPGGTAEPAAFQASLRDSSATTPTPSIETLGYFRMSLRDRAAGRASQILVTLDFQPALLRSRPVRVTY